jgi:hypothetical protein
VITFNNGTLKMNETDVGGYRDDPVTSDSIFRIMSVSKNVAFELGICGVEPAKSDGSSKARPRYTLTHGAPGILFARERLE